MDYVEGDFVDEQMVMTTGGTNISGYNIERPGIDELFRASPEPGSYYRCPVSTPLHGKRPNQKIPESVTFVSLDFSQVKSSPKQNAFGGLPAGKKIVPRRKNMDYYYIDKSFQKRIAQQSNTSWLKGLCAQPVEEIFTKYRKQSELRRQNTMISRSFSTPGEKAILEAWENNSYRRLNSATSRSSRQSTSTQNTVSPPLEVVSKSIRQSSTEVSRNSSRSESTPHPPSPGQTPREADPAVTNSNPAKNEPSAESSTLHLNFSPFVDDDYYEQFKRQDSKLPDIHKRNNYSFRNRRLYLSYSNQNNVYSSPRELASSPFKGGISPRVESSVSGSRNCSLCAWDEGSDS